MNNKFKNACIYTIQHKNKPELLYIGSTINFIIRKCTHKNHCLDMDNNCKLFQIIRSNGGWNSFTCDILIKVKCNNSIELRTKENEIIQVLKPSMNSNNAISLLSKYEYHKKYNRDNRDRMNKYQMLYTQRCKAKKKKQIEELENQIDKIDEFNYLLLNNDELEPEPEPEPEQESQKMDIDADDKYDNLYSVYDDIQFIDDMTNNDDLLLNDFIHDLYVDVIVRNRKRNH